MFYNIKQPFYLCISHFFRTFVPLFQHTNISNTNTMKKTFLISLLALCAIGTFAVEPYFRATWVSTVANIDFPRRADRGNDEAQKQHLIQMLDEFQAMHLNAIVFQVRPTADALYKSELEPWSHWLTGKQGQAAGYDPLEFVCTEAHKRGIGYSLNCSGVSSQT